jgi:hypothetical protein
MKKDQSVGSSIGKQVSAVQTSFAEANACTVSVAL